MINSAARGSAWAMDLPAGGMEAVLGETAFFEEAQLHPKARAKRKRTNWLLRFFMISSFRVKLVFVIISAAIYCTGAEITRGFSAVGAALFKRASGIYISANF